MPGHQKFKIEPLSLVAREFGEIWIVEVLPFAHQRLDFLPFPVDFLICDLFVRLKFG